MPRRFKDKWEQDEYARKLLAIFENNSGIKYIGEENEQIKKQIEVEKRTGAFKVTTKEEIEQFQAELKKQQEQQAKEAKEQEKKTAEQGKKPEETGKKPEEKAKKADAKGKKKEAKPEKSPEQIANELNYKKEQDRMLSLEKESEKALVFLFEYVLNEQIKSAQKQEAEEAKKAAETKSFSVDEFLNKESKVPQGNPEVKGNLEVKGQAEQPKGEPSKASGEQEKPEEELQGGKKLKDIPEKVAIGAKGKAAPGKINLEQKAAEEKKKQEERTKQMVTNLQKMQEQIGPAQNLYSHIPMFLTIYDQIKKVAHAKTDEIQTTEMEKLFLLMDPITRGNVKPQKLFTDFIDEVGFKELDDPKIKLIQSICMSVNNIGLEMKSRDRKAEIEKFEAEYEQVMAREAEYKKNVQNFVLKCNELDIDATNLNPAIVRLNDEIREGNKMIDLLGDDGKGSAQLAASKKAVEDAETVLKPIIEKIAVKEEDLKKLDKLEKEMNSRMPEFEKDQLDIIEFKKELAGNEVEIMKIDEIIAKKEQQAKAYDKAMKEKGDLFKDRKSKSAIEKYDKTLISIDKITAALNNLKTFAENEVNLHTLSSKAKNELSNDDILWIARYDEAKKEIIDNLPSGKESKAIINGFKEFEKDKTKSFPSSFYDAFGAEIKDRIGELKAAARELEKANPDAIGKYKALNVSISEGAGARAEINAYTSSRKSFEDKREDINKKIGDKEYKYFQFIQDVCKTLKTQAPISIHAIPALNVYVDVLNKKKEEVNEEINKLKTPAYYKNEKILKENQQMIKDLGFFRGMILENYYPKQSQFFELRKRLFVAVEKKKESFQTELKDIFKAKNELANKYANLYSNNELVDIKEKLDNIANHILDKPKDPKNIKKSAVFQNMENKLHEVKESMLSATLTQDEKIQKLRELRIETKKYIDAKNDQYRPKYFASEQRYVRLHYAKEIYDFVGTAIDLVKSTSIKTPAMEDFLNPNVKHPLINGDGKNEFDVHISKVRSALEEKKQLSKHEVKVDQKNIGDLTKQHDEMLKILQ